MGEPGRTQTVHAPVPAPVPPWEWRFVAGTLVLGAICALAAALVRLGFRGLEWLLTGSSTELPSAAVHLAPGRRLVTPVIGALLASCILIAQRLWFDRSGIEAQDYVDYVEAVRLQRGCIPLVPNLWRTLSAAFSVASGAAVGREGSMIQFAAAVASVVGQRFAPWPGRTAESGQARQTPTPLQAEVQPLLPFGVACGVAAGVTAAYNAPLAGVCFAAEIVLGGLRWHELPWLGLAAGAGWATAGLLLGFARLYPLQAGWPGQTWEWALLPLAAVLFGGLGPGYQKLIRSLRAARSLPWALLWGGLVVGALSLKDVRVWGNGDLGLDAALQAAYPAGGSLATATVAELALLLGLRLLATTACVGTGTVGGVFTPTLFAGAASGALLAGWLPHGESSQAALVGMSCLLAAVTHAPCMATLMTVELTGEWRWLPLLLPLNWMAWRVARRLSGQALYALASQAPAAERESRTAGVGP